MLISLGISAIYAVIFVIFRDSIISCFNKDREVIAYGSTLILYLAPLQMINTVTQIDAGALRGEGDSKGPMFMLPASDEAEPRRTPQAPTPLWSVAVFAAANAPFPHTRWRRLRRLRWRSVLP